MFKKSEFIKTVITTLLCNSLVWYEYALYGHLIGTINLLFFPSSDPRLQLISSFGTFAVGFLMRPVGAIFFGHVGDKYGRRIGVLLSIIMMFVPVALLAILPTYHTAGISAVIMLVLVRMLQGFALGGEVGNVLFLIECSPPKYRGFFGSFEVLSAIIGAAMSSVVVLICNALISQEEFLIWGWRIPFIAGTAIGIIGSIFRACSGETPVFENSKKTVSLPLATLFRKYKKALFVAIGIDSLEETSLYLFLVFLNVYFTTKMGFSDITFELIHLLFLGLLGIFTLLAALFSDFFGRKLMLLIAAVSSIIFAYPIFLLMESGLFPCIIIAKTLFVLIVGLSLGPVSTAVYEILPVEVSYTGLALSRNISSALFGGMAPAFAVLLISASGTSSAGAIPLIIVGLVTLFSLCFYKPVEKFEQF